MKFMLTCEEMDGLVLTDKNSLTELDSNLLYSMDIFLDPSGKSELVYDFPDETWDAVRMRETQPVKEFCNSGKMIIWSFQNTEKECEIISSNKIPASPKWLYLPSGSLLAVSASELIQCPILLVLINNLPYIILRIPSQILPATSGLFMVYR